MLFLLCDPSRNEHSGSGSKGIASYSRTLAYLQYTVHERLEFCYTRNTTALIFREELVSITRSRFLANICRESNKEQSHSPIEYSRVAMTNSFLLLRDRMTIPSGAQSILQRCAPRACRSVALLSGQCDRVSPFAPSLRRQKT